MDTPELLPLLPSLQALLRERNVTRAARAMGISQSRMSARLAHLRQLLQDPLLSPAARGRGLVPTPRAEILCGRLSDALLVLDAALAPPGSFDPQASRRTFRILADDSAAAFVGPALVTAIGATGARNIRLAFLNPPRSDVVGVLERGEAELLVGLDHNLAQEPTLTGRTLFRNRFVVVQRKGHPRGTGPMDLDAFEALDHVVLSEAGGSFTGPVDTYLATLGRTRHVTVSVQGLLPTLTTVARSNLIATLPLRLVQPFHEAVDVFEAPFGPPVITYGVAWHARMQIDPAHLWLRKTLIAAFAPDNLPGAA